ncbi:hypothetical protein SprV_0100497400 [Sparganum proliferum]
MLMDAYRDERPELRIAYRTDGQLLNHWRMHFQSRVSTTTVHELLFADDCALNATTETGIQRGMYLFAAAACDNLGLFINTEKTVVMHQPPPEAVYIAPQINVNGAQLQVVDNSAYLGSTLSRNTKIEEEEEEEVARLLSKASQAVSFRVESPRPPTEQQTQDVQGGPLDSTSVRSGDLDLLRQVFQEAQPLPPQLPSQNTEAETAGQDTGHGSPATDRNSQHLGHAEATETAI